MRELLFSLALTAVLMLAFLPAVPAGAQDALSVEWVHQFGTEVGPALDVAFNIEADSAGNVYVAGYASLLPGQTNPGAEDAFIRKYDGAGNELWTRQFGSEACDVALGVATDASGVYVAGYTRASFAGQPYAGGSSDAFVRRYDAGGNALWTRLFGTEGADIAGTVFAHAGGVYVAGLVYGALPGQTYYGEADTFLRRYDSAGNEVWTRQFGSSEDDSPEEAVADASGVYVVGTTRGSLPGYTNAGEDEGTEGHRGHDAFICKYDAAGNELWLRQFGTPPDDWLYRVSISASGVYVGGYTWGALPGQTSAGNADAFVRRYDAGGSEVWTRQFGGSQGDAVYGLCADAGGVDAVGPTGGTIGSSYPPTDGYVHRYDAGGTLAWTYQFGTSMCDQPYHAVAVGSALYVAGETDGALFGQTPYGALDVFVVKFALNAPPVITGVSGPLAPVAAGSPASVSVGFTDPDAGETHTCTFSWDDGAPDAVVPGVVGGICTATHAYSAAGVYTVTVAVADEHAATAQGKYKFVVVYDPGAGFVTGGGWINSPAGAYAADPGLTGKAHFGFVAKYPKGTATPTGQTEFRFASLNFHSEACEWLVIAGGKALYRGTGTINGHGSYGFLLSAIDGRAAGGGADRFRLKIWDRAGGSLVYDNNPGAEETADPATPLGGGSIVIHKG